MLNKKALAGTPSTPPVYVEDVFSTYLVTGTGSGSQTITNNIDLAGEGGMVWWKTRNFSYNHYLFDTTRGATNWLVSNETGAQSTVSSTLTSFNADGFTIGDHSRFNGNTYTDVSWTFRKAKKFFDVVTYTGNGSTPRNISHNLGSTPGMIIIKRTSTSGSSWWTWHRSISTGDLSGNNLLNLNNTNAQTNIGTVIGTANSTTFQVGDDSSVNLNGDTYVAYLFAHDAGGFGTAGTDNVISCGSYNSSSPVNLGYEPQWIMFKSITSGSTYADWYIVDNMRGLTATVSGDNTLSPNLSSAEIANQGFLTINSTGFTPTYIEPGKTYIYMAIRRPMKTPTSGTEVFSPLTYAGDSTFNNGTDPNSGVATRTISSSLNFDVDMSMTYWRSGGSTPTPSASLMDRLRGIYEELRTYDTSSGSQDSNTGPRFSTRFSRGFALHDYGAEQLNTTGQNLVSYVFRRATGFFDVVCYTGTGSQRNLTHNLGKAPGMVIVRGRSSNTAGEDWAVWHQNGSQANGFLGARLNTTQAYGNYGQSLWQNDTTAPDMNASTISLGTNDIVNASAKTYVAYLFGEVSGVSKVGSYTGTGTTQTINCGFTAGARFVLIKRTDSTGDWYIWDTARGIVSGNDPYLLLNSTAAEVTNTDYIDPVNSGFEISSTAPAAINANGGSFIFMAIA